jgi:DNA-binding beta-propeller fold protein YncE
VANESQPGTITPVNTATNTAGRPIHTTREPFDIAITPDGKTAYVLSRSAGIPTRSVLTPINTATNAPGQRVYLNGLGGDGFIAITPNGKTAYVLAGTYTVHPIATASNVAGPPIQLKSDCQSKLSSAQDVMAITPDGKTVYVACQGAVVPISTATSLPGRPIRITLGYPMAMAAKP